MSSTSFEEQQPGLHGQGSQRERAPRTNLLLAAAIEAGALNAPVRIRNLSEGGAMLEGAIFPAIGAHLTLRRLELDIGALVVWHSGARCGVRFEGKASVPDWVSGRRSIPAIPRNPEQARIDAIQAAIRAGTLPPASPQEGTGVIPHDPGSELPLRLAEELAYVRRLLDTIGDKLTDEPIIMQRHSGTLQSFDLASQILGHIAAVLAHDDPPRAVDAIGMKDLRARLLRKAMFGN